MLRSQRRKLETAFNYVKVVTSQAGSPIEYGITYEIFVALIQKVYPKQTEFKTRILFKVLDIDGSNVLRNNNIIYTIYSKNLIFLLM